MTNHEPNYGIDKKCCKCGLSKDLSEFHRDSNGRMGRVSECKDCKRIREGRVKHIPNYKCFFRGYGVTTSGGYPAICFGTPASTVRIHRLLMEEKVGRRLSYNEDVHHIDGDVWNWDVSNLIILKKGEHTKLHSHEKIKNGSRYFTCSICGNKKWYKASIVRKHYQNNEEKISKYQCGKCRWGGKR